ncbi:ABC transporter permease [Candidatus Babeliales bacterium]|nr:ABC transporter permease [Candidatus Babeliales bacterium]
MFKKQENRWLSYTQLMFQLVRSDMTIYKGIAFGHIINTISWVIPGVLVATYALPLLGISQNFGALVALASIVTASFFESFGAATAFVGDLEGNQTISFPLTLPMPSWLVLIQRSISYICKASIISIIILPVGKLLLLDKLNLSNFSSSKFFIVFFSINLCSSFFGLLMVSMVASMSEIMKVWNRFLFPLWFFGCSQYPWETLHELSPKLAYVCLANPYVYGMEGIRAAALGQEGYLPYWSCVGMLLTFAVSFGIIATRRLKKRLDFV